MNELQKALDQLNELIKKVSKDIGQAKDTTDQALLIGKHGGLIDAENIIIKIMYKL